MPNLALLDLVLPYVMRGQNLGAQHAALSALRVVSWHTASDAFGAVMRGQCEFNGFASINPTAGGLQVLAGTNEAAPAYDPTRRTPVFDISETRVEFELFVPRSASAIIANGAGTLTPSSGTSKLAQALAVLNALDSTTLHPDPSDYPATGFTLDLILEAPTVRPPFLHPAKLDPQGILLPDSSRREVAITLPKLRFRLTHGNAAGSQLAFALVSAGVSSLDDPGDIGVAELLSMDPPYAFIGGDTDRVFGIGFRSATLDLSSDSTPPAVMAKSGVGDDWTGLYLPEVRIFVAPEGAKDFAFEAGANELLIGFGADDGIWGDFEAALINQGSGELKLGARFFDPDGKAYAIEADVSDKTRATARIPAMTRMVVDVEGGRTPYTRKVSVNGGPQQSGAAFQVDLGTTSPQDIVIDVTDSSASPVHATLTIRAERRSATPTLPAPGAAPQKLPATLDAAAGTPKIVIASQTDTDVLLTTDPPDPAIRWRKDSDPESAPSLSFRVPLGPGESHTVYARKPGASLPSQFDFYFYFDEPQPVPPANETSELAAYGAVGDNISIQRAKSAVERHRDGPHQDPLLAYKASFDAAAPMTKVTVTGEASYEGHDELSYQQYNYQLARRRAIATREHILAAYPGKNFDFSDLGPKASPSAAELAAWNTDWLTHTTPDRRDWWRASVQLTPAPAPADQESHGTLQRPAAPPAPPPGQEVRDPPVPAPKAPDWFRSAKLKVRVVRSQLIALEIDAEVDFQTAAEQKLSDSGQLGGNPAPQGHTLQNGAPLGPDNPADGITRLKLLCQGDPATGRITTLIAIGADPADKDGLAFWGWLPGQAPPASKDYGLTLFGSYLSFWPMLAAAATGGHGEVADAALTGTALALPGAIAALPWFQVERVIVYGGEYLQRDRGDEFEGNLLFDVGIDWSLNLLDLIIIEKEHPLSVRYKAIGLRFGNRADDGGAQFALRPVFDSSRGYTIDLANGGALKLRDPLGQILRVLGARLSRTNPLTFEIDIGLGVDLGVVSVDRAGVRAWLDGSHPPELTALAAHVDIPGALVGSGYMQIGQGTDEHGATISTIGGQLDLTLRPVSLRVAAAVEVAQIPAEAGGPATGVYVGLNVLLPVALPLGSSGLGIFGFRGIFGMHYQRADIGAGTAVPALEWLKAADGKPHLLINPSTQVKLWVPHVDEWAFGLGILIGTVEGGYVMNLDGTLLIELPGPRVLILLNARIISPPPSVDQMGGSGGILAVIEVTPEHFLIGIVAKWEIEHLIKIVIPVEAVFPFAPDSSKWHVYLGARPDLGQPVEVDVLGIVKGTGYLVFKGDGIPAYHSLPAIQGFGIGLGVAAAFEWGDTGINLYLHIGGGMDAVLGLHPFVLGGTIYVSGELHLFIISIGADAELTVIVNEQPGGDLAMYLHGEACGHVSFFFFEVKGCVDITISGPKPPGAPLPDLIGKVSLKSRSPALLQGTGVDRGIDASLGDALAQAALPAFSDTGLPVVPVDVVPVIAMNAAPFPAPGLQVGGLGTATGPAPGVPPDGWAERGGERYKYDLTEIALERIDPSSGAVLTPAVQGSDAPVVWWTVQDATGSNPLAQLALLTWEPAPATKAIERTEHLDDMIKERWGRVCSTAAPPADVLWTFRWERLGASGTGWELEGIAWPDPAGTVRTQAPDTTVHVSERWRSGDPTLDALRGLFPALVVGAAVPCHRAPVGTPPIPGATVPRVVVGGRGTIELARPLGAALALHDPVYQALVHNPDGAPVRISATLHDKMSAVLAAAGAPPAPLPAAEVLRRLQAGEPLSRIELAATFGGLALAGVAAPSAAQQNCEVRLLEAPMFDDGRAIVFGDPARQAEVKARMDKLGVTHGPLDDVVVLHTGAFVQLDLLLFVRREALETKQLVARGLDIKGNELFAVAASAADLTPSKPLPPHWTDPAGPWADAVAELLAWHGNATVAVYLRLPDAPAAVRVEIGMRPGAIKPTQTGGPSYYVGAFSALTYAERARHDWDQTQVTHDKETITNALGPDSSKNSLLFADSLYRVRASWKGTRQSDAESRDASQTFWFKTDRISGDHASPPQPRFESTPPLPVRLDPWMLVTLPAERESCCFGGEPVRLVFNTHDVDRVFAAYGKELRVRFQAASARHPVGTPSVPHPFPLTSIALPGKQATLQPVKAAILSPWEEAAQAVLKGSCVPVDGGRVRHSVTDIPIPLEPYTGYILDVELVDAGAPAGAAGPSIYRRHFETGAFATLADFAGSVQAAKALARGCDPGAFEAIAAYFAGRMPSGAELDDQLRQRGMEPLAVPKLPAVTVFWSQSASQPPQPEAVLIDASEPLWRTRPYPAQVTDDSGPQAATRWVLADTDWLAVADTSATVPAPSAGALVDTLMRAPGGQRALVVFKPGQRGKRVRIELVAAAFPGLPFLNQTEQRATLVDLTLDRAPWEES